jgi:hypothetical protein
MCTIIKILAPEVKGAGMKVKLFLYYLFKILLAAHNSL